MTIPEFVETIPAMHFDLNQINNMLDGLHEPFFLLNDERIILLMNKPAKELFGDSFIGRNFVRLIRHPDVIHLLSESMAGHPSENLKVVLEYPHPATFEFRVGKLETDSLDKPLLTVALKDMTELQATAQMRSDFVANVSHELRSPLTALSGFIETIRGPARDDPESRDRFLGLMEREASRMVRLISDLLSLSRVAYDLKPRTGNRVDMARLLSATIAALRDTALGEGKSISLETGNDLGEVYGDEDELTQVVINLAENAIKYSRPDSLIQVRLNKNERIAGFAGEVLTLEFEDQGEGIAREHIPRLTERFYRVDTHRSRDKGGTGLGLAIVKHIVQQHRGRLQIASVEGKGSVFSVHLPIANNDSRVSEIN